MLNRFSRRGFIARLLAFCAWPMLPARAADDQSDSVEVMVHKVTGGAIVQTGRVKLEVPEFADNGNSVSLKVSVDSPMTASDYVKSIHLYGPRNPRPNIANFYFGPRAGRAQVSTRVRLGGTQRVLVIAALSDGSFWSASADVVVTLSACYDAT
ncbi:MAG: sulfur oxidation protein SoxY [Betaproteobacteria bacterium]|jgi:sulfur-oxidizing protein SoxY|nr:sulfur oxidation protein SoxY [Betaproteobacteria bacterium]